jgi:hypothetical protein
MVYLLLHLWVLNREYLPAFREMLMTSIYPYRLDLLHFQAEPIDRVGLDRLVITQVGEVFNLLRQRPPL